MGQQVSETSSLVILYGKEGIGFLESTLVTVGFFIMDINRDDEDFFPDINNLFSGNDS
jgi:hypothetical protein